MLVHNLLRELIDTRAGDVRFDVTDVVIQNEESQRPQVSYSDANGVHEITCIYIVGCDGDRGVSHSSIPADVLTKYSHEFGYAWLAALVEAPVSGHPIMGISDHGCVAQLPRGPQRSRYYLQCALFPIRDRFTGLLLPGQNGAGFWHLILRCWMNSCGTSWTSVYPK